MKEDAAMSLHLLGIARHDVAVSGPLEVPPELRRHGVCWVAQEDVAAAVMPSSRSPLAPLAHAKLLEAIHCRMDVLPVRYGVEMPDKRAVRDLLRQRRSELLGSLKRLEGTGEIGLRIELAADEEPLCVAAAATTSASTPMSPLRYLASRRRQYERNDRWESTARRVADHYLQALDDLADDCRRLGSRQPGIVRLAFLVERSRWAAFRRRAELLIRRSADHACTLLGPWPPYSFV